LDAERPANATDVIDYDLLREVLRQLGLNRARDVIRRPPGRVRHDQCHQAAWKALRERGLRRGSEGRCQRKHAQKLFHRHEGLLVFNMSVPRQCVDLVAREGPRRPAKAAGAT
jgi:hypothetical protein